MSLPLPRQFDQQLRQRFRFRLWLIIFYRQDKDLTFLFSELAALLIRTQIAFPACNCVRLSTTQKNVSMDKQEIEITIYCSFLNGCISILQFDLNLEPNS